MFEIKRYSEADKEVWNVHVEQARNATFLLNRSYMDYHSDRFHDHSLMIFRNGKLYALLPANEAGDTFFLIRDSPMQDCSLPNMPQQKTSARYSLPSTPT